MMLIEIGHCRDVHDLILCHECGYINHLSDGLLNEGMRLTPGIKRGDMILCPLQLPVVSALDTLVVGLYCFRESNANLVPEIKIDF